MSHDHHIEVSRDFVDGVPSSKVTTLLNLGSTGLVIVEISVFYLLSDHNIEVSRDFVDGVLSS